MPRALVITGREEPPAVQEIDVDDPGPGQVRVAVQAGTVNGIDAFAAAGYVWDSSTRFGVPKFGKLVVTIR